MKQSPRIYYSASQRRSSGSAGRRGRLFTPGWEPRWCHRRRLTFAPRAISSFSTSRNPDVVSCTGARVADHGADAVGERHEKPNHHWLNCHVDCGRRSHEHRLRRRGQRVRRGRGYHRRERQQRAGCIDGQRACQRAPRSRYRQLRRADGGRGREPEPRPDGRLSMSSRTCRRRPTPRPRAPDVLSGRAARKATQRLRVFGGTSGCHAVRRRGSRARAQLPGGGTGTIDPGQV